MNYEEKYKNALERAKKWYYAPNANKMPTCANRVIEEIFPELKESEDKRIRKAILIYLDWLDGRKDYAPRCEYSIKDMIIWLEKQGSLKDIIDRYKDSWYNEGKIAGMAEGLTADEKYQQGWHDALEKQGEQKSQRMISAEAKEALYDKIEPKFKVGDWVLHNTAGFVYMIQTIGRDGYGVISTDGKKSVVNYSAEINYRLWTIQDAKDSDVLANDYYIFILKKSADYWSSDRTPNSVKAYCGIKPNGNFEICKDNLCFCGTLNIHPATKEQRELLFQKMRENGYYWNYDTKTIEKY